MIPLLPTGTDLASQTPFFHCGPASSLNSPCSHEASFSQRTPQPGSHWKPRKSSGRGLRPCASCCSNWRKRAKLLKAASCTFSLGTTQSRSQDNFKLSISLLEATPSGRQDFKPLLFTYETSLHIVLNVIGF